jgi:hypothetical protein
MDKPRLTIDPTSLSHYKHAWVYGVRGPQKTEPPAAPNAPSLGGIPNKGPARVMRCRLETPEAKARRLSDMPKVRLDDEERDTLRKETARSEARWVEFENRSAYVNKRLRKQRDLARQANRLLKGLTP